MPSTLADARAETHGHPMRSRAALAASVLALVGACWVASGRLHDSPAARSGGFGGDASADTRNMDLLRFSDQPSTRPTASKADGSSETSRTIPGGDPIPFP